MGDKMNQKVGSSHKKPKISVVLFGFIIALTIMNFLGPDTAPMNNGNDQPTLETEWENFKAKFGRVYQPDEEALRKKIFEDNLKFIRDHNKAADLGYKTFRVGINKFADKTKEEMVNRHGGSAAPRKCCKEEIPTTLTCDNLKDQQTQEGYDASMESREPEDAQTRGTLPTHVNWVAEGRVTPVKDQTDDCGSCWAFAAIGALEGHHFKMTGELVSLSVQNILDCSGNPTPCNGGRKSKALEYVMKGGINTEASYQYEAKEGECRFNKTNIGANCSGYHFISATESDVQRAVAELGPIAVSMNANHSSFDYYTEGIYYEPECQRTGGHAVLVVGYGTDEKGQGYWHVKNSWGTDWGEKGYFKILRDGSSHCGVADSAIYPNVDRSDPLSTRDEL